MEVKNMINKDIVDYIKAQIEKRKSKEEIKNALASASWQPADIDEAFRYAEQNIPIATPPGTSPYSHQLGQNIQNVALASPTDLLREAWGIYKARFKIFIGISLIPIIVIAALLVVLFVMLLVFGFFINGGPISLIFPTAHAILTESSIAPIAPNPFLNIVNFILGFGIIIFVIIIPIIILQLWSQAAMLFAIKDSGENIGVKESYRRGWHKIGSIFWVGLLSGIIIMSGYLFFVIPGIIFGVWFSLALYIVVAEGTGGMNAILKSKSYVTGYWWEVFWRFLFIGLVLIAINLAFGIPAWIISIIAVVTNSSALTILGSIVSFIGNIVSFLLTPLTVIYTFLVYKNLKAIKGEINSEFSNGEKVKFILAGLLGIILFFGVIAGLIILNKAIEQF